MKKLDTTYSRIKIPTVSNIKNADREKQIKKIEDFIYLVKVN